MREVERALRRETSSPHTKSNKDKIESHMLKIQQTAATLHALSSPESESGVSSFSSNWGALIFFATATLYL